MVSGLTSALLRCPTPYLRKTDRLPAELKTLLPATGILAVPWGRWYRLNAQGTRWNLKLPAAAPAFANPLHWDTRVAPISAQLQQGTASCDTVTPAP